MGDTKDWYINDLSDDYKYTLCSIYGNGWAILPRLKVFSQYQVPIDKATAEHVLKKYFNKDVTIPDKLTHIIQINKHNSDLVNKVVIYFNKLLEGVNRKPISNAKAYSEYCKCFKSLKIEELE